MSEKKQKLELTWIGKENRPRLVPRVLVEDAANDIVASATLVYIVPNIAAEVVSSRGFCTNYVWGRNIVRRTLAALTMPASRREQIPCIALSRTRR